MSLGRTDKPTQMLIEARKPKCYICGEPMTFASSGPDGLIYACGSKAARESSDDHYWDSRRTFKDGNDLRLYYVEQSFLKLAGTSSSEADALIAKREFAKEIMGLMDRTDPEDARIAVGVFILKTFPELAPRAKSALLKNAHPVMSKEDTK